MGNNVPKAAPLFRSETGVTLLGGGTVADGDLATALAFAPRLVAVDGGASVALAAGHVPEAVYGDLDSLDAETRARLSPQCIAEIPEQDSTDFDKALRHIVAPFALAVGFTGARIDHELAAYHGIVARPEPRCVVLGGTDLVVHPPREITLDLPPGTRVSLFPMASVSGRSTGLRWPIDGLEFHPAHKIGTSNQAIGGKVTLTFDGPGMLLVLPREHLPELVRAFGSQAE